MAGKEETPKCRKKTVTWTNEMIEDIIDFIELHPIVAFEAIYELMLTSFWSLISFAVQLYIIMQYKGQHTPLLPKMSFCLLYLPPKLVCIHQNFLHRAYINLNSSFLDPSFLEWRLGCKTCIVYTGLNFLQLIKLNFDIYIYVYQNQTSKGPNIVFGIDKYSVYKGFCSFFRVRFRQVTLYVYGCVFYFYSRHNILSCNYTDNESDTSYKLTRSPPLF